MESIELGPDSGPIEPKRKGKTLLIAIVAVIAVAVIACAAYIVVEEMPSDGPTLRTDLRLGDYYEYESVGYDDDGNVKSHSITRYEIVSVNNGEYGVQKTDGEKVTYETDTAEEFLYRMKLGLEYLMIGPSVEPAVIDTAWGKISCDDYYLSSRLGDTHVYVNKDGVVLNWIHVDSRWTLIATSLF